jgi:hypothetical protein
MTNDEKIADLERQVAALKSVVPATADERAAMERAVAEGRDRAHQLREARMAHAAPFTREDLSAFEAACPTSAVRDIVAKGTIKPPSADGTSGTVSAVHRSPGLPGTQNGWVEPRPIGPPPGVAAADRLMDAQDAKDRVDLIAQEARRAAVRKALAEAK